MRQEIRTIPEQPVSIVEIFDKKTGEVLETKTFSSERAFKGFMCYFAMQCDTKYFGWRVARGGAQ